MTDRPDRPKTFEEKIIARGFPDTRIPSLKRAVRELHSAICHLDCDNQILFEKCYGGELGIYKFLHDYSESEWGLRQLFPPSTNDLGPNID